MKISLSPQRKALLFTFSLLVIIFIGFEFHRTGDLFIYLTATTNYFSGTELYHALYGKPAVFFYMGNPFLTLLLYPFTLIPIQTTAVFFKLISILLLIRIWGLIKKYTIPIKLSDKQNTLWQVLTFAASLFFIYSNLHMVQFTIAMLFLSLEGLYRITEKNQNLLGAALISLAISMKISPIVLLPYLFYRRHFKAGSYLLLLCISCYFIPAIFLGWPKNVEMWSAWWEVINPNDAEKIFDMNNRKNHGISTWLSTLFIKDITDNIVELENRRYLIDLGRKTVEILIYAFRAFLVLLTLYFLRTLPFKKAGSKLMEYREVSYLLLIIPLFFPQQRIYNFIFLLPAISYLIFFFISAKKEMSFYRVKLYIFCFSVLLLNLELIIGVIRKYLWHYKSLTYASLILLVLLVFITPTQLNKRKV